MGAHVAIGALWLGGPQCMMDHMGTWPALTDEQYAVIATACDEAAMVHILDEFRARQRWAEIGTTQNLSDQSTRSEG